VAYQVLARKWRPQTFDDVLGQQAVTRTLRNALKSGRIAQAFVFAGPRGCGKTTTARILARALNCVNGPTPDPCGQCDACIEIAEGRDIDVLEIDAATHTGVDNVREVIIEGLSIAPVRNRYKVFLIDEVHMLSSSSFNALLKSIEEPPPHVVFMMATTEIGKIPDTVLSRSQVYEFRTISAKTVSERLRHIANAEQIQISDAGLVLLARAGEGSMRDSLSAFDQVRAFAGDQVEVDDVVTVLGLVGRDLVLDMLDAVVSEDAPAAFTLVERAIERGYDLRLLCRELARATRDLLILSVDRSRADDPDIAAEGERDRLKHLTDLSSREDLLRAFDALTKAEQEIRVSDQPRYNLEMTLLRLMHLRKLVPLAELLGAPGAGATGAGATGAAGARGVPPAARPALSATTPPARPGIVARAPGAPDAPGALAPSAPSAPSAPGAPGSPGALKDSFLAQVKSSKVFFYNTVVAQAYRVDVTPAKITFSFLPHQKVPKQQCDDMKAFLEDVAQKVAGQRIPVAVTVTDAAAAPGAPAPGAPAAPAHGAPAAPGRTQPHPAAPGAPESRADEAALREEAMADPSVQALFEIFPVEKSKVEEM
jgi:DNA polymerase-3 subunit gamma/tau